MVSVTVPPGSLLSKTQYMCLILGGLHFSALYLYTVLKFFTAPRHFSNLTLSVSTYCLLFFHPLHSSITPRGCRTPLRTFSHFATDAFATRFRLLPDPLLSLLVSSAASLDPWSTTVNVLSFYHRRSATNSIALLKPYRNYLFATTNSNFEQIMTFYFNTEVPRPT